ncbi:MAG TPA: sensor histidine kinase [Bacteroidia bacterium]|jgi:sensor histidine kinase YesM
MKEAEGQSNYLTAFLINHRWAWHLGFWLGYIAYRAWSYYLTLLDYREYLNFMLTRDLVLFVVYTYLILFLYKKLVYRKRYTLYFILGAVLSVLNLFSVLKLQMYFVESTRPPKDVQYVEWFLSNLSLTLLTFLVITFAKYFKDSYINQYYENEQRQLKMKLELDNLKAQISPHFLFNTMNNFYGLAVDKSNKLPDLMIKLSGLLRYSLYETKNDLVPVSKEIDYLRNYIELEKIRLESTLDLEFNSVVAENEDAVIAPLILMVFIENAFKHARQVLNEPIEIKINLSMTDQKKLILNVKNNYFDDVNSQAGGLGLMNVKKRLELLYPGSLHDLEIIKSDKFYIVNLQLQLNRGSFE